jgi:hypothetical protein
MDKQTKKLMAIPPKNQSEGEAVSEGSLMAKKGIHPESPLLAAGLHDFTIEELASLVCFNEKRKKMWARLAAFLLMPASSDCFAYAYIGGGFLSRKSDPQDADLVLQTVLPYGSEAFEAISTFFVTGLRQIEEVYGVHLHFWMEKAPSGVTDFRTFFQYERSELPELDPAKGVARIDMREPRNLASLRGYADSG